MVEEAESPPEPAASDDSKAPAPEEAHNDEEGDVQAQADDNGDSASPDPSPDSGAAAEEEVDNTPNDNDDSDPKSAEAVVISSEGDEAVTNESSEAKEAEAGGPTGKLKHLLRVNALWCSYRATWITYVHRLTPQTFY